MDHPTTDLTPITRAQLLERAQTEWSRGTWYEQEAFEAIHSGRFLIIPNRNDANVYLGRFWRSEPKRDARGELESANARMLHFFARGDDDHALHDHPWSEFTTELLIGSYEEHLPPLDWDPASVLGPAWDERIVQRRAGERRTVRATDLHCVGRIQPGTWTAIETGPRVREWGFHPPGERWVPFREFLAQRAAIEEHG